MLNAYQGEPDRPSRYLQVVVTHAASETQVSTNVL